MTYELRLATIADLAIIQELTIDGIQVWAGDIYTQLKPWADMCCSTAELEKKMSNPAYRCWVAENCSGEVIGCIFLDTASQHMGGLYCSVKGQGVGSALLLKTLEFSADAGFDHMSCEIYDGNVASISLMKKYGAVKVLDNVIEGVTYEQYHFPAEALSRFTSLVSV